MNEDSQAILQERLVNGEISIQEYKNILNVLSEKNESPTEPKLDVPPAELKKDVDTRISNFKFLVSPVIFAMTFWIVCSFFIEGDVIKSVFGLLSFTAFGLGSDSEFRKKMGPSKYNSLAGQLAEANGGIVFAGIIFAIAYCNDLKLLMIMSGAGIVGIIGTVVFHALCRCADE
ncbi:hypothetical protein [Maridesulfovibrio sp.]|uniref:hypothetical protein n=1 Tax=Maridesulfovibrio sp. TaxID=2795000 RepID=UPI0039F07B45